MQGLIIWYAGLCEGKAQKVTAPSIRCLQWWLQREWMQQISMSCSRDGLTVESLSLLYSRNQSQPFFFFNSYSSSITTLTLFFPLQVHWLKNTSWLKYTKAKNILKTQKCQMNKFCTLKLNATSGFPEKCQIIYRSVV